MAAAAAAAAAAVPAAAGVAGALAAAAAAEAVAWLAPVAAAGEAVLAADHGTYSPVKRRPRMVRAAEVGILEAAAAEAAAEAILVPGLLR